MRSTLVTRTALAAILAAGTLAGAPPPSMFGNLRV